MIRENKTNDVDGNLFDKSFLNIFNYEIIVV